MKFRLVAYQDRGFGKFSGWDLFRPLVDEELITESRRKWLEKSLRAAGRGWDDLDGLVETWAFSGKEPAS